MTVTAINGVRATGQAVGIKGGGVLDAALLAFATPSACAAVFTTNKAPAAPVQVSQRHLDSTRGRVSAIVVTSGNANAATGASGVEDAEAICESISSQLNCPSDEVLICQTGLIGIPFPLDAAKDGISSLGGALGDSLEAGHRAAEAILTTDTFAKQNVVERSTFRIGSMAKGAAMLAPNMATMLAVIVTDAQLDAAALDRSLRTAVAGSFNSLDVDGATSTNDTVILVSTGVGDVVDEGEFAEALSQCCSGLADAMAYDAEGATKAVRITVTGALTDVEAHRGARKVATSQLVKCSFNGEDPYWGRVLSEVATAGIEFDPRRAVIAYGGIPVSVGGVAVAHDSEAVARHMADRWISVDIELGLGEGVGSILTTDLGYGYIDENRTTS